LRRVQQTIVGSGELSAKEVATHGGEQAVDLTPSEEHQTREHDEQARDVRKGDEEQDPDTLQAEGDEHRVFSADVIRDPPKEWPRQSVQNAVQRERERKGSHRNPEQGHWDLGNLVV